MFLRLLVVVLIFIALAATLLSMRQRRIDLMHESVILHRQMTEHRYAIWDQQAKIANHTKPDKLNASVERAQLDLEPIAGPLLPSKVDGLALSAPPYRE